MGLRPPSIHYQSDSGKLCGRVAALANPLAAARVLFHVANQSGRRGLAHGQDGQSSSAVPSCVPCTPRRSKLGRQSVGRRRQAAPVYRLTVPEGGSSRAAADASSRAPRNAGRNRATPEGSWRGRCRRRRCAWPPPSAARPLPPPRPFPRRVACPPANPRRRHRQHPGARGGSCPMGAWGRSLA